MQKDKTFYITYWASKHKKHITRQANMMTSQDMVQLKKVCLTMCTTI